MATITSEKKPKPAGYPTWKAILELIKFRPILYIFNQLSVYLILLGWLAPALVMREFFNLITGDAPARFDLWALL
ncbi:MAG: hypothetical protein ACE5EY_02770, partial [Anaerolineae bacterium]